MPSGKEIFGKTIWAEARGEPLKGQKAVANVIRERAAQNKSYFGGGTIKGVCLKANQFECWNNTVDIDTSKEQKAYEKIRSWSDKLYDEPLESDPSVPDHYNNPQKEGYPSWTENCEKVFKIGNHQFYRCN